MSEGEVCGCVVAALAELAPDPRTEVGRYYVCWLHRQMVIWDGGQWRWSDKPEDIRRLPRTADCATSAEVPD